MIQDEKEIKVSLTITNTSEIKGKEIVQVYVGKNDNSKVFKAQKQLKAYAKIELDAHESKDITLSFNISELAYYNTKIQDFVIENGNYPILVGKNSLDVKQVGVVSVSNEKEVDSPYSQKVNDAYNNIKDLSSITSDVFKETINGISVEEPTKHPFTLETSLRDFNSTRSGRFVLKLILKVVAGKTKVNKKEKDETKREQMIKNARFAVVIIPNNCLRSLSQSSGGIFPMNMAKGLLHMANGHFFKGVATILKKEK